LPAARAAHRRKTSESAAPKAGEAEVDAYIARSPAKLRGRLQAVRETIRATAPGSTELISYSMPGYCYPGYDYKGMFAWFALQSGHIGLYVRPPTIANHRKELAPYRTTKSAVHLPLDGELPIQLIQKLVRASLKIMKERSR
jgi:uncharacterized protein YdhG (YjbR/CyaY superfamily)